MITNGTSSEFKIWYAELETPLVTPEIFLTPEVLPENSVFEPYTHSLE